MASIPSRTPAECLPFFTALLVLLAVCCGLWPAPGLAQQTTRPFVVDLPAEMPRAATLAPGATGEVAFTVQALGDFSGDANVGARVRDPTELDAYDLVPLTPRCAAPTPPSSWQRISFAVTGIGIGERVTCRYAVKRAADAASDLRLAFCQWDGFPCDLLVYRGAVPDTSLHVEAVSRAADGSSEILRLRVRNHADEAFVRRDVETECLEFGEGFLGLIPFTLDTDLPGGCADGYTEGCLNFTGQLNFSYGFRVGPLPAGGEASCLVRRTFVPDTPGPRATLFRFYGDRLERADGSHAYDPNAANDIVLPGGVVPLPPEMVPLSPWAAAIAACLLVLAATLRMRGARFGGNR